MIDSSRASVARDTVLGVFIIIMSFIVAFVVSWVCQRDTIRQAKSEQARCHAACDAHCALFKQNREGNWADSYSCTCLCKRQGLLPATPEMTPEDSLPAAPDAPVAPGAKEAPGAATQPAIRQIRKIRTIRRSMYKDPDDIHFTGDPDRDRAAGLTP